MCEPRGGVPVELIVPVAGVVTVVIITPILDMIAITLVCVVVVIVCIVIPIRRVRYRHISARWAKITEEASIKSITTEKRHQLEWVVTPDAVIRPREAEYDERE
jgi:ABC-type bacteriocin/lantibiotic exporter with double-glycine peptidase domain